MYFTKEKINSINKVEIFAVTFINDNNFSITFYTYGGYIHNILIPYKNNPNKFEDVILGYNNFKDCLEAPGYFNSIIGRVGNRIANSEFELNNQKYKLSNNVGPNHLHGGTEGFNKKIWNIKSLNQNENELSCELEYFSKDLEEGYPGNVTCITTYTLNNKNEFIIKFSATSDADTLINITNHNYWNFHGHGKFYQKITDHSVKIFSDKACENDEVSIPTGNLIDVKDSKYDFLIHKIITDDLLNSGGIDNNYDVSSDFSTKKVAEVFSKLTRMGVIYFTNQPGVQFYTGNMMANEYDGKENRKYGLHYGLCLEPQFFPNAINQLNFMSPILKTAEKYSSTILMKLINDF